MLITTCRFYSLPWKVSAAGVTRLLRACTQSSGDPRKRPEMGSTLPPAHRVRPLLPQWVGGHDWSGVSAEGQWRTRVRKTKQNCLYVHIIPFLIRYTVIASGFVSVRVSALNVWFFSLDSSAERVSKEKLIKKQMWDIMSTEDLESLTCRMVRYITGKSRLVWSKAEELVCMISCCLCSYRCTMPCRRG